MKVKDINKYRQDLFDVMMKNEEIQEKLKKTNATYLFLYEIQEESRHEIVLFDYNTQISGYLRENNYKDPIVKKIYTINRQTKQVY